MRKAFVHAVADGPIVVQRSENLADFVQYIFNANYIEKSLLLAGKRGVGQILCGSGRTHRKRGIWRSRQQLRETVADMLFQFSRKRLALDHGADLGARMCQRAHVLHVQGLEPLANAANQVLVFQKLAKSKGGGGKAAGHFHPARQLGNHFPQAGVFAAHRLHITHAQMLERNDPSGVAK